MSKQDFETSYSRPPSHLGQTTSSPTIERQWDKMSARIQEAWDREIVPTLDQFPFTHIKPQDDKESEYKREYKRISGED